MMKKSPVRTRHLMRCNNVTCTVLSKVTTNRLITLLDLTAHKFSTFSWVCTHYALLRAPPAVVPSCYLQPAVHLLCLSERERESITYNLPGWIELLCTKLTTEEELSGEKVAEMIIAGSRYQDSVARELREVARDKIKERREIMDDPVFRERLREDHNCVVEFIKFII